MPYSLVRFFTTVISAESFHCFGEVIAALSSMKTTRKNQLEKYADID
jgi:hypothetical protein